MAKSELINRAKNNGWKMYANEGTRVCAAVRVNDDTKHNTNGFARVSLAYCSEKDTFNKRIGKETAINRSFMEGQYILVPCKGRTLKEIAIDATNGLLF